MKPLNQPCPSSNCDACPDRDCGLLGCFGLVLPVLVLLAALAVMA